MQIAYVKENYFALTVSILRKCSPERAFGLLDGREVPPKSDTSDMVKLRNRGMTYQAIADLYGTKANTVFARIKRAGER